MHATVDAHALRTALLRLKPRRSRFRSLHEPSVEVTAGGTALVMMGTLDSSASVAAVVSQAGTAHIPLEAVSRLLATYAKGTSVVIRSEPGKVWFDKFSLTSTGER
ncbi:hypothetical protein JI752_012105 [Lysobacter sp. MMG2]|uniref:hypothetical protein n=1 Tax=Lysobacter sp. MMG2 TaxID=2801338 RepID=UPI001C241911|nr:hypothetical protein [Lysobacter sp. MMG2]MBU8976887.1 hypothetical protein [Lysobacter sp. MMG2]